MKEWRENSMMKNRWPVAFQVIETLENAGFEAYVVGGAVRDFIRGVHANDVDITTSATPSEVKQLFSHTIDVGIEHGTVLVVLEETIEVTTFRSEATYSDFRRPDQVAFVRSLREDLERRDFTMNAMALSKEDVVIDYFEGQADIEANLIKAVGDPLKRFSEDALRMLRVIRFSAQLDFQVDENTLEAIQSLHELIRHVSIERVKVELEKIWTTAHAGKGMDMFVSSNLAKEFPGDWSTNVEEWKSFSAFENKINGWAFFALSQEIDINLAEYKCSNAEMMYVKKVLQAANNLEENRWSNYDFFQFEENVLVAAASYTSILAGKQLPYSFEEIHQQKMAIPLASSKDIVVNGNDLMEWAEQKRGPWLKEVIDKLTVALVNGEIQNDRKQIRDWFFREYDN
ncbi:CCA tRNA nucleotidyltransferase [Psychrobacillus sp.]|uniref:CCA tRNA nucleotidyltransferase n=1 Tax=Psychrobacillus sp. TaxID=1871623 RepID=UPI0028BE6B40|nr:CCA tRNA nucleotidyltransferase [Psychrobacillus sp.]